MLAENVRYFKVHHNQVSLLSSRAETCRESSAGKGTEHCCQRSSATMELLSYSVLFLIITVPHLHGFWLSVPDNKETGSTDGEVKTPVVIGKVRVFI